MRRICRFIAANPDRRHWPVREWFVMRPVRSGFSLAPGRGLFLQLMRVDMCRGGMMRRMLDRLDDVPWQRLGHAYGAATDVPGQLRDLLSDDVETRRVAIWQLGGNIVHQAAAGRPAPMRCRSCWRSWPGRRR